MKFRIIKEDGWYRAEYRRMFMWWHVAGSYSRKLEETRKACEEFKNNGHVGLIESFKL